MELDEVQELLGSDTLLVDARSREAFAEGHLPGAHSLPRGEFDGERGVAGRGAFHHNPIAFIAAATTVATFRGGRTADRRRLCPGAGLRRWLPNGEMPGCRWRGATMISFRAVLYHGSRLLLGAIFCYAGLVKALDVMAFAGNVANYQLLPYQLNFWSPPCCLMSSWPPGCCCCLTPSAPGRVVGRWNECGVHGRPAFRYFARPRY
ncbi:MAG: rhodanese-like domain-containing protein [Syntrophotaleaceae bacterium]